MSRVEAKNSSQTLPALIRKLKRLARITRVRRRINATMELDRISRICLRELIDMVGCDRCAILQFEGDTAKVLAERGFLDIFGPLHFIADMPAIKDVVATKKAIITGGVTNIADYNYTPYGSSINSLLCGPIAVDRKVTGVVYMDSKEKDTFNDEDMEFTQSISDVIAEVFKQGHPHYEFLRNFVIDEATTCLKRTKFDDDIMDNIADATKYYEPLSLMRIGIDSFPAYRDSNGEDESIALTKKVADIMMANIRAYHEVYYYAEGEFAVLMETSSKEQASNVAIRLKRIIEQEHFNDKLTNSLHHKITASIGVTTFPSDSSSREQLIEVADFTLFKAQKSGGNQIYVFSREEQVR